MAKVTDDLRYHFAKGRYRPGDRCHQRRKLTQDFEVVVREATVPTDWSRHGMVSTFSCWSLPRLRDIPFTTSISRNSSLIQMLEIRAAVEGDAAGLAALRAVRSPATEKKPPFPPARCASFR